MCGESTPEDIIEYRKVAGTAEFYKRSISLVWLVLLQEIERPQR
jgi:hypothetical protein